jgi:UDP-N-acetylmuramoylalanine--D-glutamate ligase
LLELEGSSVLVLGLGTSGRSAARFCAERGARVVAADERAADELRGLDELGPPLAIELRCGQALPDADAAEFDLVVPSPGVPRERYAGHAKSARVWGDIELAFRALRVPIAAVTGTNGKSTTTCLLEALLTHGGLRAGAAGNLGEPALGLVGRPLDVAVLEVSSFQLETIEAFRPSVALILNITPDHLDRHGDVRGYVAAKARILENQHEQDAAVLNIDDPLVAELAAAAKARVLRFSRQQPQERGVWLDGDAAVLRDGEREARVGLESLALPGRHNRDNAAMALCAAMALGADLTRAAEALPAFHGLPHRCELVCEIAGVRYVDDSKATNPGAAARALEGVGARVLWIAGGRDKGLEFAPLAAVAERCVRVALLIGEASDALDAALPSRVRRERCETLAVAVERAAALAERGDVVLLAPACASFDQFESFAARGDAFRASVEQLGSGART